MEKNMIFCSFLVLSSYLWSSGKKKYCKGHRKAQTPHLPIRQALKDRPEMHVAIKAK